ncbi:TonB-dependent receptor (plasmid) [Rhizorhabdus wittichii RW1]|uniref:TonB-dependent receptor n=1 Tax=Rhizorhabdus wittichii (strain DSM 6014 / CCUG 31198 / JCM 15750 / NBRC 105917 / EY 4224 / RW1) TaxID=392499 RepID=A0A9J9LGS2_RHIWR|nr:TonB-dependent receptor [Sphingobium sp. LB126]ABQ71658.1 TonB-dependent receptor [Rhizorhabdus wittichii RW1]PJG45535.1 TonB-dependent receptor [Sphingobium sp. LB126]
MNYHKYCIATMAAPLAMYAAPSFAQGQAVEPPQEQATSDTQVEEIIVTAQRRGENLQNVPIAITALSASRLQATGVLTAQDLSTVTPSLQMPAQAGYLLPRLRGIGTSVIGPGIENTVALYVDGVYQASSPASIFSLTGIERIEVLKGPQGTLFGRNATGGLIQIVTREPEPGFSGNGAISYGNYDTVSADAYIAGGSDTVRVSLAGRYAHQGDGFGYNFARGEDANTVRDDLALRGKMVFLPADGTKVTFSADYARTRGSYPEARMFPGAPARNDPNPPSGPFDTNNNTQSIKSLDAGGASLRVDQDVGAIGLTSISAYRRSTFHSVVDLDRTPANLVFIDNTQQDRQFSQELQLHSTRGSTIDWLVGGYYFWSKSGFEPSILTNYPPTAPAPRTVTVDGNQSTESLAAFGQLTVPLTDQLRATAGLRYTTEKRSIDTGSIVALISGPTLATAAQDDSRRYNKLTWRAALDYQPTPDVLLYLSYNRGFKSGGFNVTTPGAAPYEPEVLDAFEFGAKLDLFDRRLRINSAVFYYDYSNIQVAYFIGASGGTLGIRNGSSATVYGADVDLSLILAPGLTLQGGASLIHDRFGDFPNAVINTPLPGGGNASGVFQAKGNRLPFTSDFSGNIGLDYARELSSGKLTANVTLYYNDGYYPEADNIRRVDGYAKLNASLGWRFGESGVGVRIWGRNLTNKAIPTFIGSVAAGTGITYEPPRTYGASLTVDF